MEPNTTNITNISCLYYDPACVQYVPLYGESDQTLEYQITNYTLYWGLMNLFMFGIPFLIYYLQVNQNKNLIKLGPYVQYNFTAWFMWISYGTGTVVWLINYLFDYKGGRLHLMFFYVSKIMIVPPFITLILAAAIYFSYGNTAQVQQGLRGKTIEDDNNFYYVFWPLVLSTILDIYVIFYTPVYQGIDNEFYTAGYLQKLRQEGCTDRSGKIIQCSVADLQKKYGRTCTKGYTADGEKCIDGRAPW